MTRIVTLDNSSKTVPRQHRGQTVKPVKSRFVCMHLQRMRGRNLSDPDHPTVSSNLLWKSEGAKCNLAV